MKLLQDASIKADFANTIGENVLIREKQREVLKTGGSEEHLQWKRKKHK